jgi:hypothetical protein
MTSAGIFGPKLSGKTTLAIALSKQYWETHKMRSMVFDPHCEAWGEQAWVTANEDEFWPQVWKTKSNVIIVEEAATTINRSRELIPVFTRLRHCNHKLIIVGHSGTDLLPVMRQQLDTLYLFRQPEQAAKIWANTFADERILAATTLRQYEFLWCQMYGDPVKKRLGR